MNFEWDRDDRYRSNFGNGPETARILCVDEKHLTMERWVGKGRPVRFRLPIKYFNSSSCGWVRITQ